MLDGRCQVWASVEALEGLFDPRASLVCIIVTNHYHQSLDFNHSHRSFPFSQYFHPHFYSIKIINHISVIRSRVFNLRKMFGRI